jgi:hypothetical protein
VKPLIDKLRTRVFMFANRSQAASRKFHVVLAVAFLFVMLVEWGSHNLAFAHSGYPAGMVSVNARESDHDDPCKSLTCCQSRKDCGTVVSPSHHLPSYNSYSEAVRFVPAHSRDFVPAPSLRENVRGIFRPKDPLLHPPEFS